ncbi:MAG: acylphosphatase [Opitutaceae bacterium]|nr:acylphosphatase [Opitutaceae bacterium]
MAEVQHVTIHYTGHVQGVGFRYTTLQIAKEFEVAGHVRNLPDGRVEVEVEGTREEIAAFAQAVEERMHGYIRKVEQAAARRAPRFQGFTIR